jgi:hypothetical protein
VLARRDASAVAVYPCAYVEYINAVEFGLHTGCYFGTLRLGAVSYADDDIDREDVKKITGALRSWLQQEDLLTQLNATTAGKTLGQHVQFYAVQLDSGASYIPFETGIAQRLNEIVIDAMAVARPSYP